MTPFRDKELGLTPPFRGSTYGRNGSGTARSLRVSTHVVDINPTDSAPKIVTLPVLHLRATGQRGATVFEQWLTLDDALDLASTIQDFVDSLSAGFPDLEGV